ncbi:MAG: ABC transporter permease [Burkholderiaceae bacterium]
MLRFLIRRLLLTIPVFIGLTLLVFAISRVLPGDPVQLAAGPQASAQEVEQLRVELGLDRPLPQQYWTYLKGLSHGNFGESVLTRRPVAEDLAAFLPATLELVFTAMGLAIVLGIPLGMVAAVWRDRWPDYLLRVLSLASISMPRFFLGLLLQLALAMWLGWLPLTGRYPLMADPVETITGFLLVDCLLQGRFESFGIAFQHLLLPAFAMCLSPLATLIRMMRASVLDVLQQDYVLTARALGLPPAKILFKYVLKNALSASLTVIGLYFGWLLGGTVLVETVFDWPGIGLYATKAIVTQDMQPVMAVTLCIGVMFVVVNTVIDALYGVLNPKVTHG